MKAKRLIIPIAVAAAVVAVIFLGIKAGILLTLDTGTNLLSPRFTADGKRILYVEREATGVAFGPGIEFFTPPAYLHVFSDRYALKEMDFLGKKEKTYFHWTMPRRQFWIPAYRNRLFGYPQIDFDIKGDVLRLSCRLSETDYPQSIQHDKQFWYNMEKSRFIAQADFEAVDMVTPWHKHRLSGPWEVMDYSTKAIILERFAAGISQETRVLRDFRGESQGQDVPDITLSNIRQRPELERLEAKRLVRQQLVDRYTTAGMSLAEAQLKAIDDLEDMGISPKGRRIVARRIDQPLDDRPVFIISDMEFKVGLFQDIDRAIASPGKEIRHWGDYVRHRDYTTSRQINAYLKTSREFQVQTSRGVFEMKILN